MGTDGTQRKAKKSLKTSARFPAQPPGDGGGEQPGWVGVSGEATPHQLNQSAQWQAAGMKAAGSTGARTAPPGARAGLAVSVTGEAAAV